MHFIFEEVRKENSKKSWSAQVEFNVREKFDLLYILLNDWPYNGSSTYGLSE